MLQKKKMAKVWSYLVFAALAVNVGPEIAHADTLVDFSWTGVNGYSVTGSFTYNPATTPASFLEAPGAVGPTKYLDSFSVSFFNPQHGLLESGSSVVNGVTTDRFFTLNYNSQTETINSLDADIGTSTYQYFLTNFRTPSGQVVPAGVTGFNLFYRPGSTPNLDTATSVIVTAVSQTPEPATTTPVLLGLSGLGALVLLQRRKRQPLAKSQVG